jgi:hypothetical protein
LQARQVREHPADGRRPVLHPVQVLSEAVVEVERSGVAELHDRGRREGLRDRADAVLRRGRRVSAVLVVGGADGVRPDDLALAEDRCRDRREPVGLPLLEQALELLARLRHGP